MKKLLTLMFVASLALAATSCKKDYTCDCVIAGQTISTPIANSTKSDAETACTNLQTATAGRGTCTLK